MKRLKSPLFRSLARTLVCALPSTLIACSAEQGPQSAQDADTAESAAALGVEVPTCSQGANSGFATNGTLGLALVNGTVSSLVLGVVNGYVTVNGYTCVKQDSNGVITKLTPTLVKKVTITGTGADEKVVIDTLSGNLGSMISATGGITVDMAGGNDSFSLRGSNSADKWTAGMDSGNVYFEISGDKFADVLVKNDEAYAISLSGGADTFTAQGGAITASNLAGSQVTTLTPITSALTINGGDGDDVITGGNGADTIDGGNGNDTFKAAAVGDGDDTFKGGAGTDKADYSVRTNTLAIVMDGMTTGGDVPAMGTAEADVIGSDVEDLVGGSGADTLTGNGNANHIQGGGGDDVISGGPAGTCTADIDVLDGEAGNDIFDQSATADCGDTLNGGAGTDTVDYEKRTNNLTILLDTAANDGETGEKDNIKADVEVVLGGQGNDNITGSANADEIHGGPGDDVINAGGGNDKITGNSGNDTLNGEAGDDTFVEGGVDAAFTHLMAAENFGDGNDIINGGTHDQTGVDTVDYSGRSNDLTVTLCVDGAHLTGAASGQSLPAACSDPDGESGETDSVINLTHVIGGAGKDTLTGAATDDILEGGANDDKLYGGAGNDSLYGDAGDDVLEGDDGNDTLDSGANTTGDTLDGDQGGVNAGDGDVCIYNSATDTAVDCEL